MPFVAAGAGAALGAFGGGQADVSTSTRRLNLPGRSILEKTVEDQSLASFRDLQRFAAAGPGVGDVSRGLQAQRELAEEVGRGPGLLLSRGQDVAQQLFAPQRLALQQQFEQQGVETSRLSAQLGRQVDDPILRAKLAQAQGQQLGVLGSQQAALSLQLGRQFGQEQLAGRAGRAQILGGLGQQAFGTQQGLLGLGQNVLAQERQFRLARAGVTETTTSGGGLKGAITGALGGAGAGLNLAQGLGSFGGGGGGGAQQFGFAQQAPQGGPGARPFSF